MAEQFAVTQIPGAETGEIPPSPVDRDEKTAFIYQFDYFSFLMIRNGYVIHSATGKYDDADLAAKPKFYGNTDYGRMNMKVVTSPDVSTSEWQLVYLPSLVTKDLATAMGRPDSEGSHRFQVKPESIRTASAGNINWFMQATPYDNLGHEMPPRELVGLMTFSFDLIIPAGEGPWTETYTRDAPRAGA